MTARAYRRPRLPALWPFWLLVLAWVCANRPQVAAYGLITWVGNARHFTHRLLGLVKMLDGAHRVDRIDAGIGERQRADIGGNRGGLGALRQPNESRHHAGEAEKTSETKSMKTVSWAQHRCAPVLAGSKPRH